MARPFAVRFYHTQAWKKLRADYAKQAGHLCEDCLERGLYVPGEIVHHVIELTPENIGDPDIALNPKNLRLVCRECHKRHHNEVLRNRRFDVGPNGEIISR